MDEEAARKRENQLAADAHTGTETPERTTHIHILSGAVLHLLVGEKVVLPLAVLRKYSVVPAASGVCVRRRNRQRGISEEGRHGSD